MAAMSNGIATIAAAIKRPVTAAQEEKEREREIERDREREKERAAKSGKGNIRALPSAPPRYKSRIST
jgi:hypothetical protein